ncbi:hypothetical protein J7I98_29105 [Streptomyces sp. ISL-98]|uniref:hypothetical protein n=1 Tax=Streptomyces sp. ISL-98 TaxID=2819192 RepID=UPI001BE78968|nr:hypothetical protein [Streptomyces sp. ISL-98]MBT2509853.1 hypothetical protein [Streptomyces sp. ISL-98]
MELCHQYGIPHSQFTAAGDGRWTALDRETALSYLAYTRTVRQGCGTRVPERDAQVGGDHFAYIP